MIDFTTTATARPDILYKTYKSFNNHLKDIDLKNCTLYINIDPVPELVDRNEVLAVAESFFGVVVANMPAKPNFTAAYNWIWDNAKSDYIFNLEDDWVLIEDISINKLLKIANRSNEIYAVPLRAYSYVYDKASLSPSLLSRKFYGAVGGNLDISKNPEIQLRGNAFGLELGQDKVYAYPKHVVVKDIGREWIKNQPFKRPGIKSEFNAWVMK